MEKRKLESHIIGLSEEQITEKDNLMKLVSELHPHLSSYMIELCVDFCIRFPEEAAKVRESKEWDEIESIHKHT